MCSCLFSIFQKHKLSFQFSLIGAITRISVSPSGRTLFSTTSNQGELKSALIMPNMARVSGLIGTYKMLTERKKELSLNSKKLQRMRDLFDIWSGHMLVNSRMNTLLYPFIRNICCIPSFECWKFCLVCVSLKRRGRFILAHLCGQSVLVPLYGNQK